MPEPKKKKTIKFSLYWMYAVILLFLGAMWIMDQNVVSEKVSYSRFGQIMSDSVAAANGGIKKLDVFNKREFAEAHISDSLFKALFPKSRYTAEELKNARITTEIGSSAAFAADLKEWQARRGKELAVDYNNDGSWGNLLWSFGPFLLIIFLWIFIMRRISNRDSGGPGGVFSVGKSKAQIFDKDGPIQVTFKDVAGLSEAKTEIEEIVEFLKNPQRYTDLGGKIPKGALLVGPPGTGKTLLAKAVAGEANVPFFSMSGSDFVEMFVGVGASRVRDLFRQAKEKAPCIVFIDEIDAVGRARGKNPNMGANDERENTLNQLLTEMDGFGSNSGVIILAATNRADILDKALLRAGRFDRQIYVDLPDLNDRVAIFNVHLRKIKVAHDVDVQLLARQTPGFSGADIANVCNEAALIAARNNKKAVDKQDFIAAVDRIIGGLEKRSKITTDEEKRAIAIHEAGHAALSWHLQYANPLVKVTIVPRGKALGAAWYLPEERQITPTQALLDEMCATLGGRAAEELFLGRISTGAANDLERVTKQAYAMVVYYGMSERLPNISYYDSTGQDYGFSKPYSDDRARLIDEEVLRIINEQYERAKKILGEHAEGHARLAEVLLKREVIFTEDVEQIFGKRQWTSRTDEILAARSAAAAKAESETRRANSEIIDVVATDVPAEMPPMPGRKPTPDDDGSTPTDTPGETESTDDADKPASSTQNQD
ncbi:MAG: ATP-dependent zinc metalloprotease FtsH [Muribaculaceae bacterium]|nr:ATP-dependent zinc metalloprotease FtsH [Muribaculaceae bacterium]